MRFTTSSLLALLTATTVFIALIGTHPAAALGLVSLGYSLNALDRALQAKTTATSTFVLVGAAASFTAMMVFGLATILFGIVHSWFHSLETRQHVIDNCIGYATHVLKFILVLGTVAAIGGGALGICASAFSRIRHRNRG